MLFFFLILKNFFNRKNGDGGIKTNTLSIFSFVTSEIFGTNFSFSIMLLVHNWAIFNWGIILSIKMYV